MSGAALSGIAMSLFPLARQIANPDAAKQANKTILWLALGAVIGIIYTLGTEKYVRVMQHRHLFVRFSMLFLAALAWLGAAVALGCVCVEIVRQNPKNHLEGFERVLGALIPAVVRADLIVDWARRVSWVLLNFRAWMDAMVQMQRIFARTRAHPRLRLSTDTRNLVRAAIHARFDFDLAEDAMWAEDTDSLVHVSEIIKHFRKLARLSIYAALTFIGAIPATVLWIFYAIFKSLQSAQQGYTGYCALYAVSIVFSPFGAIILLIGSAALLIGVVTLSVIGTIIQFIVYWSTRVVYSMVRGALSEQWAQFPVGTTKRAKDDPDEIACPTSPRFPDEAGAAMARCGGFFPTELEFALAPWDGTVKGDDSRIDRVDLIRRDEKGALQGEIPAPATHSGSEASSSGLCALFDNAPQSTKERHMSLLAKLGLDVSVNTKRKRRLATYYTLGMFVHMQVESGGLAWRLDQVSDVDDVEFRSRIAAFDSLIAMDAYEAAEELGERLRKMSKYRIVHSGNDSEDFVMVQFWIRALVLFLVESSGEVITSEETDGSPVCSQPIRIDS